MFLISHSFFILFKIDMDAIEQQLREKEAKFEDESSESAARVKISQCIYSYFLYYTSTLFL